MGFIRDMMGISSENISSLIIYAIIVVVFIIGLFVCIMPVVDTRRRLKAAVRYIKAGDKARKSWQEDNFLGRGTLMSHWSAYLNNLFFADGVYHNASNVEDFINEETVIYGPGRSAFADAVPSLLVSIGFLGTLIGLSQGLSGFNMSDAQAVQDSIVTLIPGMRYAFMTSIFGVVGSVLFTMITRVVYGSTEHVLRSFYGAMSRHAGVLSVDPLTQVAIYQQEQTALIQTMARDLNGAFTENMAHIIREAVAPINQSLNNFLTVNTKDQLRFLDAVVMRFVDRMNEVLGDQFQGLARTLEQTSQSQQLTAEVMRDLRNMQAISREMVDAMSGYMKELRNYQAQSDEAFRRLTSNAEQLDLVSRQQTNYLKSVTAMQTEVARSVEKMTGAVTAFTRRFAEDNAIASNAMQKAAGELREAGAHIENIQKNTTLAIDQELKTTLDAYRGYVNQFTQRVDYLAASIADSLGGMPRAVSETSDHFLDQVDRLTQTLEQAQRALAAAVDRMYRR